MPCTHRGHGRAGGPARRHVRPSNSATTHGRVVLVDPIKPTLKAPVSKTSKLKCDELLSNVAFKFNLRRCTSVAAEPVMVGGNRSSDILRDGRPPRRVFFEAQDVAGHTPGADRARAEARVRPAADAHAEARRAHERADVEVDAVVARMRAHSGDAAADARACEELRHIIINNAETQTRAGARGAEQAVVTAVQAVDVVVAAMYAHPQSEEVQQCACRLLAVMTDGNAANRARAGSAGAVEAAVAAMVTHPRSGQVQQVACATLMRMTHDTDPRRTQPTENQTQARDRGAVVWRCRLAL